MILLIDQLMNKWSLQRIETVFDGTYLKFCYQNNNSTNSH